MLLFDLLCNSSVLYKFIRYMSDIVPSNSSIFILQPISIGSNTFFLHFFHYIIVEQSSKIGKSRDIIRNVKYAKDLLISPISGTSFIKQHHEHKKYHLYSASAYEQFYNMSM